MALELTTTDGHSVKARNGPYASIEAELVITKKDGTTTNLNLSVDDVICLKFMLDR